MSEPVPAREGSLPFRGYDIWYRMVGEGKQRGKLLLVCLHGGPGALIAGRRVED